MVKQTAKFKDLHWTKQTCVMFAADFFAAWETGKPTFSDAVRDKWRDKLAGNPTTVRRLNEYGDEAARYYSGSHGVTDYMNRPNPLFKTCGVEFKETELVEAVGVRGR